MKRINKNIIMIIIGLILGSYITVGAVTILNANEIGFENESLTSTNVQDAIDELYGFSISEKDHIIVRNGVINNDLIGNFDSKFLKTTSSNVINIDDSIRLSVSYKDNSGILYSVNKIDVTNYDYLNYYFIMSSNHDDLTSSGSIGLSSDTDIDGSFVIKNDVTMKGKNLNIYTGSIDVSELTGEYYFKLKLNHGSEIESYTSYINLKFLALSNNTTFNENVNIYKEYYDTYATNYSNGYNAGVTAADARANTSSTNYISGYNAGVAAASNNVSTLTSTQTKSVRVSLNGVGYVPFSATFSFPHGVLGLAPGSDTYVGISSISGNTVNFQYNSTWSTNSGTAGITVSVIGY